MPSHGLSVEHEPLREKARRARIGYEIFPVLTGDLADEPARWLEIALHAEVDTNTPLDCRDAEEAIGPMREVAEWLAKRIAAHTSCEWKLSCWYYTARPPLEGEGPGATRLFRSLSLVVLNPPWGHPARSSLLADLCAELEQLEIFRLEETGATVKVN